MLNVKNKRLEIERESITLRAWRAIFRTVAIVNCRCGAILCNSLSDFPSNSISRKLNIAVRPRKLFNSN